MRQPPDSSGICPTCGADARAIDGLCWLCKARVEGNPPPPSGASEEIRLDTATTQAAAGRSRRRLASSRAMLYVTLGVVAFGTSLEHPGALTAMAIFAAPAIIGVEVATRRALEKGVPEGRPRIALSFFVSWTVTAVLLYVSAWAAVLVACSTGPTLGEGLLTVLAVPAAIGILYGIVRACIAISSRLLVARGKDTGSQQLPGIRIATVMLVVAELTVAIGVGTRQPGLGVLLGILLIPGTIQMTRRAPSQAAGGAPLSAGRRGLDYVVGTLFGLAVLAVAAGNLVLLRCMT